jgi:DNA repair protein RadC
MNYLMSYPNFTRSSLQSWREDDRPRERLAKNGAAALSEHELLAILIGSGLPGENAVDLARRVFHEAGNDLAQLARLTPEHLKRIKGIGTARAIQIVAAVELGRRRQVVEAEKPKTVSSSRDVFSLFYPTMRDLQHEEFWVLLLNRANRVMGKHMISKGGVSGTIADPKVIFNRALLMQASAIILLHNHPSGNTNPSQADRDITRKLKNAGELLDLPVLDHLIVAEDGYFSFADEGIL